MALQLENFDPALRAGAAVLFRPIGLTSGTVVDVIVGSATTATILKLEDFDQLTTGTVVSVSSASTDTSTRNLVSINNSAGGASGTTPLRVNQVGTLAAIRITGLPTKGIDLSAVSGTGRVLIITETTDAPSSIATVGYLKIALANGTARYIKLFTAE